MAKRRHPRQLQARGIILKKNKMAEADDLITFFSPTLGKIQALSFGSRKIASAFCGHLETLNICDFQLYQSPYRVTITQAVCAKNFKQIRGNFKNGLLAMMLLEIFERSTWGAEHEEQKNSELFTLLEKTLDELEKSQLKNSAPSLPATSSLLAIESFKLKLLDHLGALPDIASCSICQKRWQGEEEILLEEDGQLHCNHKPKTNPYSKARPVEFKMIKAVNFLLHHETFPKIKMTKIETEQLRGFTATFLRSYLNREIHSEKLIAALAPL